MLINKTVSICVPVYNASHFVTQTLNSVFEQKYTNTEVVVVDDGSDSYTRDLIQSYRGRVTLLQNTVSLGAAASRNRALEAASGSFVLFLDSDDVIAPDHIGALLEALERGGPRSVAFSRWGRFRDDLNEADFPPRATERDLDGIDWLLADWEDTLPMTQCGMFLIPRRLLDTVGGWDERLSLIDDFEFFARLIAAADGLKFAPEACLYYRSGLTGSLSGRKGQGAVESQLLSLMLGTGHVLAAEDTARTRRSCANLLAQFDYEHYPDHTELRVRARDRVAELGGADIEPIGPPNFHRLRRLIGWRAARRIQRALGR